ncbi:hypothetical protein [Pararhizobium sp. PWRC1-1]
MPDAIMDLLESAKILSDANSDYTLSYLIGMAILQARETAPKKQKKAA